MWILLLRDVELHLVFKPFGMGLLPISDPTVLVGPFVVDLSRHDCLVLLPPRASRIERKATPISDLPEIGRENVQVG